MDISTMYFHDPFDQGQAGPRSFACWVKFVE